jgi:hypothetical protein
LTELPARKIFRYFILHDRSTMLQPRKYAATAIALATGSPTSRRSLSTTRECRDRAGGALPINVRAQWEIASLNDFRFPHLAMLMSQLA